jgi:hypothetical protein
MKNGIGTSFAQSIMADWKADELKKFFGKLFLQPKLPELYYCRFSDNFMQSKSSTIILSTFVISPLCWGHPCEWQQWYSFIIERCPDYG